MRAKKPVLRMRASWPEKVRTILDVGGELTRPGSDPVRVEDELRDVGVVRSWQQKATVYRSTPARPSVMEQAVKGGAAIINDVSALQLRCQLARRGGPAAKPVVLMHAQGDPRTMQLDPRYDDVALDVYDYLEARVEACTCCGHCRAAICIDPGIGFGKTFRHNLELMQQVASISDLGVAVLVGVSRKGMIGALTGEKLAVNRVSGSVGGALYAALQGVHIVRVHDVRETAAALAVAQGMADPQ